MAKAGRSKLSPAFHSIQADTTARVFGLPLLSLLLLFLASTSSSQAQSGGPTNPKAQKTFAEAVKASKTHDTQHAIDLFRKADKQDDGHCTGCARQAAVLALKQGDYKLVRDEAMELERLAQTPEDLAMGQFMHGLAALRLGMDNHKEHDFIEADAEMQKVIAEGEKATGERGNSAAAIFEDGVALANLHQDDAARTAFSSIWRKRNPAHWSICVPTVSKSGLSSLVRGWRPHSKSLH
jgi:hypothetical protein